MIVDYILKQREQVQLHKAHTRRVNEDVGDNDPSAILRQNGVKIKKVVPKEKYIEIHLFDDLRNIDMSILDKFYYKTDTSGNKILVSYNLRK